MTAQVPSSLIPADIDLGNGVVYYGPAFSLFSDAKASTKWRKFGLMKDGVQVNVEKEFVKFFSGFPARLQKQYVSSENLSLSGTLLETRPRALARALGGLTITETVKSSSPAPTTVATGSTKNIIQLASATGYANYDEIRVGNSGAYQYGRIKSLSGNAATLYEALSEDTNPTTGHAVAKLDETYFELGSLATPAEIGIKIEKTLVGGYGTYTIYILKAQVTGSFNLNLPDGGASQDGNGYSFALEALSDPDAEGGKTARWYFNHT